MHNENDKTEALGELTRVTGSALVEPGVKLNPGTPVGRYVILEQIGRGGMGEVYSTFDPRLDRRIALKFIIGAESEDAERLLEEARTLAQLSHPNVLPVFDVGTFGRSTYVATEFVQGGTLRDWLNAGERDLETLLKVFRAAGEGINAAHKAGVIHRDIKPSNILIGDDERVRVADFGVAKRVSFSLEEKRAGPKEGKMESWSSDGHISGTPTYMSPEQIRGEDQDARTDQFSFGCALYEALTGNRPFDARDLPGRLQAIREQDLSALNSVRGVSDRIKNAVRRMLAFEPKDRFGSMEQVLEQLSPPSHQKRWLLATVASLVVALGAAGIAVWQGTQDTQAAICEGGAARLTGIWDDPRRQQLQGAFGDVPGEVWQSVVSTLNGYSSEWVEAYRNSCTATNVLGEQSPQLLDLSMNCLDGRLAEIQAATNLFQSGDLDARINSVRVVGQLSPISACVDRDRLLIADPLPEDPEQLALYQNLRDRLAEAKVLSDGRRYEEAIETANRIADESQAAGFLVPESVARRILGDAQERTGVLDESEGNYVRATHAAIQANSPEPAAWASAGMAWTALRASTTERALDWVRLSESFMLAVPDEPRLKSYVHSTYSTVYQEAVEYETALHHATLAHEILLEELGPNHLQTAAALANLGNTKRYLGDYEAMMVNTRKAIEVYEGKLGFKHRDTLQLYTNMAGLMNEMGRSEEGLPIMVRVKEAMLDLYGPENLETGFQNINLGIAFQGVGRHPEAIEAFEESLGAFTANLPAGHVYFAYGYNGAAQSLLQMEQSEEALSMIIPAWEIVTSQETHPQLVAEIGMVLLQSSAALNRFPSDLSEVLAKVEQAIEDASPSADDLIEPFAELKAQIVP